ncbi:ribosomal biogenesis protein LAS1L-like [Dromiciops gliroides]|uniref:ribosomal biogenesis protein LAS1L-like n=1 Tax=Dromiciops gliroides TaxID=33562 RepID=UPI001CC3EE18|nr:ribosomal biogenesis protein LAS1L-like [Dromiciops gliroides]
MEDCVPQLHLELVPVLDVCLDCACWATPPILQLVLKTMEPAFPLDTQEKLMCLCTIYTQGGNPNSRPRSRGDSLSSRRPVYTLEDLQWQVKQSMLRDRQRSNEDEPETEMEDLFPKTEEEAEAEQKPEPKAPLKESPEALAEKQAGLEGSDWQLCTDDIDWSKYPIGRVPGQTDDPNELMLDNYTMISVVDQPIIQENDDFPSSSTHDSTNQGARDGLLWTQSELHHIKTNIKFF